MKIRLGFVSNSSSSSFICEVSGGVASGWDLELEDAEMHECVNGHVFFDRFLVKNIDFESTKRSTVAWCRQQPERFNAESLDCRFSIHDDNRQYYLQRYQEEQERAEQQIKWIQDFEGADAQRFCNDFARAFGEYQDSRSETLPVLCPICSLQHIRDADLLNYMLAHGGLTRENLTETLRHKFSCLSDLQADIRRDRPINVTIES